MALERLDHIALWVEDRDAIARFATAHLGMHVIEETDRFTLIGSHARHGKLTLFAEEPKREPGPLAERLCGLLTMLTCCERPNG